MNYCIRCGVSLGHEASPPPGTRVVDDGLLCPDCVDFELAIYPELLAALRAAVRELGVVPGDVALAECAAAIALAERLEVTA